MELIERNFGKFELVQITEGVASATLEMHQGYFTYYWRTHLDQEGFLQLVLSRKGAEEISSSSLTLADDIGGDMRELTPANNLIYEAMYVVQNEPERWSLLRLDEPGQSWVWQYAPDDKDLRKYTNARHRIGLAPYFGCAGPVAQKALLQTANTLMELSGIESDSLMPHLDLFARYIDKWRRG